MSDPYWSNVVLLAGNEQRTNGTTTFIDQSTYGHTITPGHHARVDKHNPANWA